MTPNRRQRRRRAEDRLRTDVGWVEVVVIALAILTLLIWVL